jgi:hypothetical protein
MVNITKDSNVFSNVMKIFCKMNNNLHKEDYKGENKMLRIQGNSRNVFRINHTKIPITASMTNFVHSIVAGVNQNINFAGVARNATYKNDINTSKKAEISEDKPSKTLVEFVDNTTQAKKRKKMTTTSSKSTYKNKVKMAKNAKIKENSKTKEIKEDKAKNQILSPVQ